jgi:hypothetical protein
LTYHRTGAKFKAACLGIKSRSIAVQSMQSRSKRFRSASIARGAKVPSQPRGRVRRDAALLIHDQADAVRRYADRLRQAVNADLFILQVFKQILPG